MTEFTDAERALIKPGRERLRIHGRLKANTTEIKPLVLRAYANGVGTSFITRYTGISAGCVIRWAAESAK